MHSSLQHALREVGVEGRVVLVALKVLPINERLDPLLQVVDVDVELELPPPIPTNKKRTQRSRPIKI
jgi:hypothetical protein